MVSIFGLSSYWKKWLRQRILLVAAFGDGRPTPPSQDLGAIKMCPCGFVFGTAMTAISQLSADKSRHVQSTFQLKNVPWLSFINFYELLQCITGWRPITFGSFWGPKPWKKGRCANLWTHVHGSSNRITSLSEKVLRQDSTRINNPESCGGMHNFSLCRM